MKNKYLACTLIIVMLSLITVNCKKQEEEQLTAADVKRISGTIVFLMSQALNEALLQAITQITTGPAIQRPRPQASLLPEIISLPFYWVGAGNYTGMVVEGQGTLNTETGSFTATVTIMFSNLDLGPSDPQSSGIVIKSGLFYINEAGNAYSGTMDIASNGKLTLTNGILHTEDVFEYNIWITVAGGSYSGYTVNVKINGVEHNIKYP